MAKKRLCAVEGCGKPYHAHGYCARHNYKFTRYGDPLAGRRGASPGEPLRWIKENATYGGDECIKWPFEIGRYGYGTIKHCGKRRVASRVMCEEAHGPAPDPSMDSAHSCGNGHQGCMNPKHLSWKTRVGNVADAINHGTWNHGERVPSAKLTEEDVRRIRALAGTMLQREIASLFEIEQCQVSRIINRKEWAWVLDGDTDQEFLRSVG